MECHHRQANHLDPGNGKGDSRPYHFSPAPRDVAWPLPCSSSERRRPRTVAGDGECSTGAVVL